MLALVVAVVVSGAPPSQPLEALNCKARKCKVTKQEKFVWKVALPGVKEVDRGEDGRHRVTLLTHALALGLEHDGPNGLQSSPIVYQHVLDALR